MRDKMDKALMKKAMLSFIAFFVLIGVASASSTLSTSETLTSVGIINTGAGIGADPQTIYWGNVALFVPTTVYINVTNNWDVPLKLSMTSSLVSYTGSTPFNYTLGWGGEGIVLNPKTNVSVSVTLELQSGENKAAFEIDMTIAGNETA